MGDCREHCDERQENGRDKQQIPSVQPHRHGSPPRIIWQKAAPHPPDDIYRLIGLLLSRKIGKPATIFAGTHHRADYEAAARDFSGDFSEADIGAKGLGKLSPIAR
jgi:hypothetical protein